MNHSIRDYCCTEEIIILRLELKYLLFIAMAVMIRIKSYQFTGTIAVALTQIQLLSFANFYTYTFLSNLSN